VLSVLIDVAPFEGGQRVVGERLLDVEVVLADGAFVLVNGHG